jgi:hypothetical protein
LKVGLTAITLVLFPEHKKYKTNIIPKTDMFALYFSPDINIKVKVIKDNMYAKFNT